QSARRHRRRANVARRAARQRDARRRGRAALSPRRDAPERARSRRRVLPGPADHRGLSVTGTPIHELTEAYRRSESTPTAATEAFLARIARLDGELGAYLTVTREQALRAAADADARYRAGKPLGPLDGAPLVYKDVLCTRGVTTTCGSRMLEGFVPPYDATVIARLTAAGAVMLGKGNMDEFAMGSSTEHSAFKPTRNPWDLTRVPGGSSGGPAAAVAAGLAAGGLGTDTGGAIRQPAAWLGATVERISLPATPHALATYYVIAPAEASSNLARYDGVKYGLRVAGAKDLVEMSSRTRAVGFGAEVKRRIMLGTYVLSAGYYEAYYGRAQKARTLVRRDFDAAFGRVDLIVAPMTPNVAFKHG